MLSLPMPHEKLHETATTLDPKQSLRAHVDQLPIEKQLEFVDLALHLIENRTCRGKDAVPAQVEWLH